MMTPRYAETDKKVKGIIVEYMIEQHGMEYKEDDILPSHELIYDIGMDSLDITEFVMAVEEASDMDIPDSKAQKFKTVRDVSAYIRDHSESYKTSQE